MTDTNPVALLRAAADRLRTLATSASHEGRTAWATGHTEGSRSPVVVDDQKYPSVLIETWAERLEDVNAYIAAMDPRVGLALADLLDDLADGDDEGVINPWALPLAERVLGEDTNQ
ncbi:hypothetical protein [Streptomyces triculaminicus]|uniref:hypothetical protein n=1 Tax=Streptomyces triculaminicus TaxID=2816232 RepID=UPI0037A898DD